MTPEDSKAWNAWAKRIANKECGLLGDAVARVFRQKLDEQAKEVQAALDRRDARIAALEKRLAEYEARDPIRLPPLRAVS